MYPTQGEEIAMFGKKRLAEADELIKELDERKAGIRKNPDGQAWYDASSKEFLLDFDEDQRTFLRYALQKEIERDQERVAKIAQMNKKELKQYKIAKEEEDEHAKIGDSGMAYRLRELVRPDYYAYDFLDAHDMMCIYRIVAITTDESAMRVIPVTPKVLYEVIHTKEELNFLALIIGGREDENLFENYIEIRTYFDAVITQKDFKQIDISDNAFKQFVEWLKIVRNCYHNQKNTVVDKPGLLSPSVQQMAKIRGYEMKYYFSTKAFLLMSEDFPNEFTKDKKGNIIPLKNIDELSMFPTIDWVDGRIKKAKDYIDNKIREYMEQNGGDYQKAFNDYCNGEEIMEIDRLYRYAALGSNEFRSILIYRALNYTVDESYIDPATYDEFRMQPTDLVDGIFNRYILEERGLLAKQKKRLFAWRK